MSNLKCYRIEYRREDDKDRPLYIVHVLAEDAEKAEILAMDELNKIMTCVEWHNIESTIEIVYPCVITIEKEF